MYQFGIEEIRVMMIGKVLFFLFNLAFLQVKGQDFTTTSPDDFGTTAKPLFPNQNKWYNPEIFSRLTLPPKALFGSRWVIENKKKMNVSHAIEVVDLTLIHQNELTLKVEFNLRQLWEAKGLEFPEGLFKEEDPAGQYVTADYNVLAYMWSPDSYISTSRESNMNTVGMPLSLVYIFKNMTIIYKVRMFTKVACSSSFEWYPLDIQNCQLVIQSYKYHSDQVRYHWTPEKLYRPVVLHTKRFFQYELRYPYYYDSGIVEQGGRGKRYAFVRLKFTFERRLGNNIIQVYTPTTLVVVLSWFSFWLGLDAIPGRISLLVTCMLTLVTMHSGIKSTIPPVHYITMMDVWLVCCMGFVFCSMCEFICVKYLHWRQKLQEKRIQELDKQKLYSIIQQVGLAGNFGREEAAQEKAKIQQGILPYASAKQEMFWNNSPKIVPVDILRSIVVEAAAAGHPQEFEKDSILPPEQYLSRVGTPGRGNFVNEAIPMTVTKETEETLTADKTEDKGKELPVWVKIDRICRACFPSLFLLFNTIYWPVLFCGSQEPETSLNGENKP